MIRAQSGLTSRLALVLLATTIWLSPSPARADDDATAVARQRFEEGVAHFDQKQYDKARLAFLQAYALKKHPVVLLNLAHSELLSGREADAAKHFSMFLREAKDAKETERQSAESGLLAAKAVVGEVEIEVDEDGAEIYIDGNHEGRSPLPGPAFMDPGTHIVEAKKNGRTKSVEVTATAGQVTTAKIRLEKQSQRPKPAKGDDEETDDEESSDAAGASESGGSRQSFFKWMGETPLAWVGAGLTVVGIAGGAGFAVAARTRYDSANNIASQIHDQAVRDATPPGGTMPQQPSTGVCANPSAWLSTAPGNFDRSSRPGEYEKACSKFTDNQEAGDRMKKFSIVSWAVAGTAAAGTIIYYFLDSGGSNERAATDGRRVAIVPVLTPTERGLSLSGSF